MTALLGAPMFVQSLQGWRRRLFLAFAGALSVLSLAPFHVWPILWITLPVLYFAVTRDPGAVPKTRRVFRWQNSSIGRAAEAGWWFGFGYHVVGLVWIAEAFLVEAEVFAWLIPVAVTGLPAGLAVFFALVGLVTSSVQDSGVLTRVLVFSLSLAGAEWLRGHILTGLPWNIIGYALTAPDALMQSAGLVGIYGLTLIAAIVFVWPWAAALDGGKAHARDHWQRGRVAVFSSALLLLLLHGYGWVRLGSAGTAHAAATSAVTVRVVQPSVPQREKWRPEHQRTIFDLHKSLSLGASADAAVAQKAKLELIVWPEAAMPFFPLDQPVALQELGDLLDERQVLISGALRRERALRPGERDRVFNSLLAFGHGEPAQLIGSYDKIHLVPFGEYLPFQRALEWVGLEQLTRLRGGFASAPWPRPALSIHGLGLVVPLICYEAIFPAAIYAGSVRPRLLLNVTNDGWFGDTIGPRQHFHQARVRSVEEGLPMIRAANNGISAVTDGLGRVRARLGMNERGAFAVELPNESYATPYSKYGDKIFFAMFMVLSLVAIGSRRRSNGIGSLS
ncbi:MAG TPA: apolipoprotein N-acyltransferase [Hyphomicrobiaceae bacterium]|nr:apolipoprotein N-acyltransferase [Hyphomicrobiaceae bacterium]